MARDVVYIALITFPPGMAAKLASKHGVSEDEVRDTFELPGRPQRGSWNEHPEHGRRLVVEGKSPHGRRIVAMLAPTADVDVWRIRTAWPIVG